MREYVEILRRYLQGDTVNFHGKMFQINGAKMGFIPAAPIKMISPPAVRSRMLQLGGEIGDGVLLSAGCAPGYIRKCADDIAAGAKKGGKSGADVDVAGFVTAAVSDSAKEAIEVRVHFPASHLSQRITPRIFVWRRPCRSGRSRGRGGERDWDAAKKFISDEVVFAHSVAGTPGDCAKQLEAFTKGGLDLPLVPPTERRRGASGWRAWRARLLDKNY